MSSLKILLAMFLVLGQARTSGPIVVGGGAGGSEFSIVFARTNLKSILSDCLAYSCGFSSAKAQSLRPLLAQTATLLPAVFKTSGEVVFNQDLLWLDAAHKVPYEISDAVGLKTEDVAVAGRTALQAGFTVGR